MKTFLFYDLETTGLNKSFDQILQFAAIRTDTELNEVERYSVIVKLRPDVIPSPAASITHRIPILDNSEGLDELEAIRHIHAIINTPGTVSLGYNTLGFDDEFLRFSFYRNLLPPYNHQYANNCGRMDLLPFAVLFYLYKPHVITWPVIDGKSTLKLEHLSSANSLAEGRAHDAIVDVEATVELAKRFIRERDMWDYILGYFDKRIDQNRANTLSAAFDTAMGIHMSGLMTGSMFGSENLYQAPVLYIGDSTPYKNQSLWLRLDLPELSETTENTISEKTYVIRKRYGEPNIILPTAERFTGRLDKKRIAIVEENIRWIKAEPECFKMIVKYYREFRYPDVPNVDLDAALYQNGFLSRDEQNLCRKFHQTAPESLVDFSKLFGDSPMHNLALRVLFRNFPKDIYAGLGHEYDTYMESVNPEVNENAMVDYRGNKRMTPQNALAEIAVIREKGELESEQLGLLDELESYLMSTFKSKS